MKPRQKGKYTVFHLRAFICLASLSLTVPQYTTDSLWIGHNTTNTVASPPSCLIYNVTGTFFICLGASLLFSCLPEFMVEMWECECFEEDACPGRVIALSVVCVVVGICSISVGASMQCDTELNNESFSVGLCNSFYAPGGLLIGLGIVTFLLGAMQDKDELEMQCVIGGIVFFCSGILVVVTGASGNCQAGANLTQAAVEFDDNSIIECFPWYTSGSCVLLCGLIGIIWACKWQKEWILIIGIIFIITSLVLLIYPATAHCDMALNETTLEYYNIKREPKGTCLEFYAPGGIFLTIGVIGGVMALIAMQEGEGDQLLFLAPFFFIGGVTAIVGGATGFCSSEDNITQIESEEFFTTTFAPLISAQPLISDTVVKCMPFYTSGSALLGFAAVSLLLAFQMKQECLLVTAAVLFVPGLVLVIYPAAVECDTLSNGTYIAPESVGSCISFYGSGGTLLSVGVIALIVINAATEKDDEEPRIILGGMISAPIAVLGLLLVVMGTTGNCEYEEGLDEESTSMLARFDEADTFDCMPYYTSMISLLIVGLFWIVVGMQQIFLAELGKYIFHFIAGTLLILTGSGLAIAMTADGCTIDGEVPFIQTPLDNASDFECSDIIALTDQCNPAGLSLDILFSFGLGFFGFAIFTGILVVVAEQDKDRRLAFHTAIATVLLIPGIMLIILWGTLRGGCVQAGSSCEDASRACGHFLCLTSDVAADIPDVVGFCQEPHKISPGIVAGFSAMATGLFSLGMSRPLFEKDGTRKVIAYVFGTIFLLGLLSLGISAVGGFGDCPVSSFTRSNPTMLTSIIVALAVSGISGIVLACVAGACVENNDGKTKIVIVAALSVAMVVVTSIPTFKLAGLVTLNDFAESVGFEIVPCELDIKGSMLYILVSISLISMIITAFTMGLQQHRAKHIQAVVAGLFMVSLISFSATFIFIIIDQDECLDERIADTDVRTEADIDLETYSVPWSSLPHSAKSLDLFDERQCSKYLADMVGFAPVSKFASQSSITDFENATTTASSDPYSTLYDPYCQGFINDTAAEIYRQKEFRTTILETNENPCVQDSRTPAMEIFAPQYYLKFRPDLDSENNNFDETLAAGILPLFAWSTPVVRMVRYFDADEYIITTTTTTTNAIAATLTVREDNENSNPSEEGYTPYTKLEQYCRDQLLSNWNRTKDEIMPDTAAGMLCIEGTESWSDYDDESSNFDAEMLNVFSWQVDYSNANQYSTLLEAVDACARKCSCTGVILAISYDTSALLGYWGIILVFIIFVLVLGWVWVNTIMYTRFAVPCCRVFLMEQDNAVFRVKAERVIKSYIQSRIEDLKNHPQIPGFAQGLDILDNIKDMVYATKKKQLQKINDQIFKEWCDFQKETSSADRANFFMTPKPGNDGGFVETVNKDGNKIYLTTQPEVEKWPLSTKIARGICDALIVLSKQFDDLTSECNKSTTLDDLKNRDDIKRLLEVTSTLFYQAQDYFLARASRAFSTLKNPFVLEILTHTYTEIEGGRIKDSYENWYKKLVTTPIIPVSYGKKEKQADTAEHFFDYDKDTRKNLIKVANSTDYRNLKFDAKLRDKRWEKGKWLQGEPGTELMDIYLGACLAKPFLKDTLEGICAKYAKDLAQVARVKNLWRIAEKTMKRGRLKKFQNDNTGQLKRTGVIYISDMCRAQAVFQSIDKLHNSLATLILRENIVVVRIKDRFSNPAPGGWSDVMVNFYHNNDPRRHVCEIQFCLAEMLYMRQKADGHANYARFRGSGEILTLCFYDHQLLSRTCIPVQKSTKRKSLAAVAREQQNSTGIFGGPKKITKTVQVIGFSRTEVGTKPKGMGFAPKEKWIFIDSVEDADGSIIKCQYECPMAWDIVNGDTIELTLIPPNFKSSKKKRGTSMVTPLKLNDEHGALDDTPKPDAILPRGTVKGVRKFNDEDDKARKLKLMSKAKSNKLHDIVELITIECERGNVKRIELDSKK